MRDEIRVTVTRYGRTNLTFRWVDPETGKRKTRSAGTSNMKEARKAAGILEKELRDGKYTPPSRISWDEFTARYLEDAASRLRPKSQHMVRVTFSVIERYASPHRLADLTDARLEGVAAKLREAGRSPATIQSYWGMLRAALRWAAKKKMLAVVPSLNVTCPPKMKGRPVEPEEFQRMLNAVPAVVGDAAAPSWQFLLRALWWGGLRLGEALHLYWDREDMICVRMEGRRPMLRIPGTLQKSKRNELYPMAPELAKLLASVPASERAGSVFKLQWEAERLGTRNAGESETVPFPGDLNWACRVIGRFGRAAQVLTETVTKKDSKTGEPKLVQKYATAHDLRRSFGFRWSALVMPAVLMKMMRHAQIATTMEFYARGQAEAVSDVAWAAYERQTDPFGADGNILGNTEAISDEDANSRIPAID